MVISTMIAVWAYAVGILCGIMILAGLVRMCMDDFEFDNFSWSKFLTFLALLVLAISIIAGMGWY